MLISERKHIKYFNILSIVIFVYCLVSFLIFIYLNWEYIINPSLNPSYESVRNAFGYNESAAKFAYLGTDLPIYILLVLEIIYFVTLIFSFKTKQFILTKKIFFVQIIVLFILFNSLDLYSNNVFLNEILIFLRGLKYLFIMLLLPFLIFAFSILLMFKIKNISLFLILCSLNSVLYFIIFWLSLNWFFD